MGHLQHRRFPHLQPGDTATLDALEAECGREAARDFERLLERQHHSDERHAERHVLVEDVGDVVAAATAAAAGPRRPS